MIIEYYEEFGGIANLHPKHVKKKNKIIDTIHKQIGYRPGDVYHETHMMQEEAFAKLFGSMRYHPYDPPECPKRMWPKPIATMNCPDDDAFKRFVQKHRAEYARIFFEEVRKLKEREKDEQENIQSTKG